VRIIAVHCPQGFFGVLTCLLSTAEVSILQVLSPHAPGACLAASHHLPAYAGIICHGGCQWSLGACSLQVLLAGLQVEEKS
jgi:hypothetical protein